MRITLEIVLVTIPIGVSVFFYERLVETVKIAFCVDMHNELDSRQLRHSSFAASILDNVPGSICHTHVHSPFNCIIAALLACIRSE